VAAVGREAEFQATGVDAEPDEALPPGVVELIASPGERDWLRTEADSALHWDRILFSTKDSAFKASGRLLGRPLPFSEIEISFDPIEASFEARWSASTRLSRLRGRFRAARGLIATTAIIAAGS